VREFVDYGCRHNFDAFIDPGELVKTITCDGVASFPIGKQLRRSSIVTDVVLTFNPPS
jgi:hypothetical protein